MEKKASTVQTLILAKKVFTKTQANEWITDHNFKIKPGAPDETLNNWRYRQHPPSDFVPGTLGTTQFTAGVQAVVGKLKEGKDVEIDGEKNKGAVQTISISKDKFTADQADEWIKSHGYKIEPGAPVQTSDHRKYRQRPRADFLPGSLHTFDFAAGVHATTGILKTGKEAEMDEEPMDGVALLETTEADELETKALHSLEKCMNCSKSPTIQILWAEGRATTWFCDDCFKEWDKKNPGEVVSRRKIDGVATSGYHRRGRARKEEEDEGEKDAHFPQNDLGLDYGGTIAKQPWDPKDIAFKDDPEAYKTGRVCGSCVFFLRDPKSATGACQIMPNVPVPWWWTSDAYIDATDEAKASLMEGAPGKAVHKCPPGQRLNPVTDKCEPIAGYAEGFLRNCVDKGTADLDRYNPMTTESLSLLDDFQVVTEWYTEIKAGGEVSITVGSKVTSLTQTKVIELTKRILRALVKKEWVRFQPEGMTEISRELFNLAKEKLSREEGIEALTSP